jgi:hypothetical protein
MANTQPPTSATTRYILGKSPASIPNDAHHETHKQQHATLESHAYRQSIIAALPLAYVTVGEDATSNMNHYLGGSGEPVQVNMLRYMLKSKQLSQQYKDENDKAKFTAEALPPGIFAITSEEVLIGSFDKTDWLKGARDLYYASGDYLYWGQAELSIKKINDQKHECEMKFWFYFYDRYNWNGGQSTRVFGKEIFDDDLKALSTQGLAREFDLNGCIGGNPTKWSYTPPSWVEWDVKPNLDKVKASR